MRTLSNTWLNYDDNSFSKSYMLFMLMHIMGDLH